MRKTLLLLAVALATFAENAWADKSFKTLPELTYGVAISPSGQYLVGVNPSYMVDGSYSVSYLYDTNTGETQWLTEFDQNDFSKSGEFKAVNDAGVICGASKDPDLLITYSDMFGTETRPANSAAIWKDGKCTLLYYGNFDTSKFEFLGDGSQATDISADSKTVCGYISIGNAASFYPCMWKEGNDGKWTLEWLALPEDAKGGMTYFISDDGKKVANVTADKPMTLTENNVPAGHPGYAVEAVFETADGGEMLSPKSNILKASVPDTYDMPLFDDFSSNSLETNYWEVVKEYGDPTDAMWGVMQDYGLIGSSISYMVFSQQPYSGSLISRPLDATKAESVSLSFFMQMAPLNSVDQDLEKDSISVDISTDFGKTWKEIKAWSLKDIYAQYSYNVISLDISAGTTGKIFQLRLRKHGQGVAQYMMYVDNLRIEAGGSGSKAPAGLTGTLGKDGKSLSLMWQNLSGAYQLNYINDPSFINKYTIGNEGKELIAANKFEPEDLAAYKGKYLSGVQTTINYYSTEEEVKGIHASVVVFEDGKMVREQEIKDMTYNEALTVALDEPLLIDGTKELMIGVKIFDYDEQQIPICYIISDKFVAGKSDLYSEDNGASWLKLSEFYNEQGTPEQGYCCWDITGCITDNPELTPVAEGDLFAYNIYRDGEQLNEGVIDRLQTRFTDPEPTEDACYQVVGFFYDGTKSEASEQFCLDDVTGIEHNIADNVTITRNEGDNCLTINGKFDNATLVDISGVCVSRSEGNRLSLNGVKAGIYIISINVDGRVYTQKMIVK